MHRLLRLQHMLYNQLTVHTQATRGYPAKPGNRNVEAFNKNAYMPPRWKKHWYLSMAQKRKIEGPKTPEPRFTRENWNYQAELSAFK